MFILHRELLLPPHHHVININLLILGMPRIATTIKTYSQHSVECFTCPEQVVDVNVGFLQGNKNTVN